MQFPDNMNMNQFLPFGIQHHEPEKKQFNLFEQPQF